MVIDHTTLGDAVRELIGRDPVFARLHRSNGEPPIWPRAPGFASLVTLILEQQVSLASARAANRRLHDALGGDVEAERFLELSAVELRRIGFSRQKADYCRELAVEVLAGRFDPMALDPLDDAGVRRRLTELRGIGPWTAECYLLFCLRRPDAWPTGDRALYVSMSEVFALDGVPEASVADTRAARWTPWRSIAARMLWHEYLIRRGLDPYGLGTSTARG